MGWDWLKFTGKRERCERCRRNPVSGRKVPWGQPKLCSDCEEEYDRELRERDERPGS